MFNPIKAHEMVSGVGLAARAAAGSSGTLDEFERGQLLSAYSATRHLVVELEHYPVALAAFTSSLARELRTVQDEWPPRQLLVDAADAIAACEDGPSLGLVLGELLAKLRERADVGARAVQALVQHRLAELAQTEVELLADNIR